MAYKKTRYKDGYGNIIAAETTAGQVKMESGQNVEKDIAIAGAVESLEDTDIVIIGRGGKRYTATAAVLRNYINYGIKVEFIN